MQKDGGPLPATAEECLAGTEEVAGSWWPYWMAWVQARSGARKQAPKKLGGKGFAPGDPAPGLYVLEQA